MHLTTEEAGTLLRLYLGVEFGQAENERLRPLIEQQLVRMRELLELDLGDEDPGATHYINDRRLKR